MLPSESLRHFTSAKHWDTALHSGKDLAVSPPPKGGTRLCSHLSPRGGRVLPPTLAYSEVGAPHPEGRRSRYPATISALRDGVEKVSVRTFLPIGRLPDTEPIIV